MGQVHDAWGWVDGERDRWGSMVGMFHVAFALGLQVFIIFYKSSEGGKRLRYSCKPAADTFDPAT